MLRIRAGTAFHALSKKASRPFSPAKRRTLALKSAEKIPTIMNVAIPIAAALIVGSVGTDILKILYHYPI
jgi:hypothetical protein